MDKQEIAHETIAILNRIDELQTKQIGLEEDDIDFIALQFEINFERSCIEESEEQSVLALEQEMID
jgi:hypothetical protein